MNKTSAVFPWLNSKLYNSVFVWKIVMTTSEWQTACIPSRNFHATREQKHLKLNFFSLIETTTKVSRVKYFSWKFYFESKTINQSMLLKTVLARMKNRIIYQGFPVWWCQLKMQNPAGNFVKVIGRAGTKKILEIYIKSVFKRFGTKSFKCCLLESFLEQLAFRIATLQ